MSEDKTLDLPEVIEEELEEEELEPEVVSEVDSPEEAVKSLDDLWRNLVYQHREKYSKYASMQESLSSMNFDRPETRIDFTEMNTLRDEIVKLEGGLETINLFRQYVLGEEPQPWVESEIKEKRKKIRVRTRPGYEKYADWEVDTAETGTDQLNTIK
ncbi:hypothetical protein SSZBM1_45 [Synechococcus phage S-SZBM1]|uniref:Uncharacterized protein n=1 Tax=Synechococcus phage S-SZBM1 TaxID=2926475 RepID=A0AC61TSE9_9CAUD|nr:hypothetical protein PP650_gp045 [Synechococcus phage S-SZBM1]UNH61162.1 hypothetical protein SSZBM1_45 [Synechococcus phage S-SZBM1]